LFKKKPIAELPLFLFFDFLLKHGWTLRFAIAHR